MACRCLRRNCSRNESRTARPRPGSSSAQSVIIAALMRKRAAYSCRFSLRNHNWQGGPPFKFLQIRLDLEIGQTRVTPHIGPLDPLEGVVFVAAIRSICTLANSGLVREHL